nr:DNA-directed RNA polymerase subunit beta [uncultured Bacillus sp.]
MAINEMETSRALVKKQKAEKKEKKKAEKQIKEQIRLIPIWLKFVIVLVLMIVFAIIGAMIGYGVLGEGSAWDVFKPSTWTHIYDLISKK